MQGKPTIASHEAPRVASEDARTRVPRTRRPCLFELRSRFIPTVGMLSLRREMIHGGGPHYVIDPTDGTIISKKYCQ